MPTKSTSKPARKMPKFKPAPESLKMQFAEMIARYPEAEPRQMFGYPSAFINGQMFICIFGDSIMLRLSEADRAQFLKMPNTKLFEPMPGRPMKEYVQIPSDMLGNKKELGKWIAKSMAYAQSLPPKVKKGAGKTRH